jgi:hypothetical protein
VKYHEGSPCRLGPQTVAIGQQPPNIKLVSLIRRVQLPDDRQYTNRVPHREQVQTERQAAEALFRPKWQPAPIEATANPAAPSPSTEPGRPREPRIWSVTPVSSVSADKPEAPASAALTQRRGDARRKVQRIPRSAHGRIKALATYGMSVADVADLYGVPVSDIVRIVSPQRVSRSYQEQVTGDAVASPDG